MPLTGEMIVEKAPFGFASDGAFGSLPATTVVYCRTSVLEGICENSFDDREKT
jgi:hypothetical protein